MKDLFSDAEREHYEERAAIREHEGEEKRAQAEQAARQEVLWARDRFRCMVRQLIAWKRSGEGSKAKAWLEAQKNPEPYATAAREQMQRGNDGTHGVWIEEG